MMEKGKNIFINDDIERLRESLKKVSDMEAVLELIQHIKDPCEVKLPSGEVKNIREFYISLANDLIIEIRLKGVNGNQNAADFLEDFIKIYK